MILQKKKADFHFEILICPRPPASAITGYGSKIKHQLYWGLCSAHIDDNDCDVENYAPKMTTSNSSYVYNGCKLDPITFLLNGQSRVLHKPTLY